MSARDDRKQTGSRMDRSGDPSLRTRVYFWLAIGVACIAAYAASTALHGSHEASHAASQASRASYRAAQAQSEIAVLVARVAADEVATCKIQQRGLPAGHELAASMVLIHRLLTIPPATQAQKLAAAQTPPAIRALLVDLNQHLSKYNALEAKQPRTRSCPT